MFVLPDIWLLVKKRSQGIKRKGVQEKYTILTSVNVKPALYERGVTKLEQKAKVIKNTDTNRTY